jgi:hypothetical protein
VAKSKTLFFLEELYFRECKGNISRFIGQLTVNSLFDNIRILDLSYSDFDDKGIRFLLDSQYGKRLHTLILAYCDGITCEGLTYLAERNLSGVNNNQKNVGIQQTSLAKIDLSGVLANAPSKGFFTDDNLKAV